MDIEKAFDSHNHSFLIFVFKKFGFEEKMITRREISLKDQIFQLRKKRSLG